MAIIPAKFLREARRLYDAHGYPGQTEEGWLNAIARSLFRASQEGASSENEACAQIVENGWVNGDPPMHAAIAIRKRRANGGSGGRVAEVMAEEPVSETQTSSSL